MEFKDVRVLGFGALLDPINISALACAIEFFGCKAENVTLEHPNSVTEAERLDNSTTLIGLGGHYFPESGKLDYVGATAWHKVRPVNVALVVHQRHALGIASGPYKKALEEVIEEDLYPLAICMGYPFAVKVAMSEEQKNKATAFIKKIHELNKENNRVAAFWEAVGITRKTVRQTYNKALKKLEPELRRYHLTESLTAGLGRLVERN